MRWAVVLTAVAAIGLYGASQSPPANVERAKGNQSEQRSEAVAPRSSGENDSNTSSGGQKSTEEMTAYERESLAVDRAANGLAKSANAISEAQREYAFWHLALGGFGVGFTGIAAFFAWRATHWAKEAARQTKRSADADNAALAEARISAEEARKEAVEQANRLRGQLRPYVYIVEENISTNPVHINLRTIVSDHAPINFSIKNFGQTPAKRVRLKARAFIGEYWTEGGLVDVEEAAIIHRADLPPGFERKIEGYAVNGLAQPYARVQQSECSVFFEGLIEYEDAAGVTYETNFRRVCTGPQIETGVFIIPPEGNEAT